MIEIFNGTRDPAGLIYLARRSSRFARFDASERASERAPASSSTHTAARNRYYYEIYRLPCANARRVVAAGCTTRGAGALDYIVGLKYDRPVTIFDDQLIDERRNVTCRKKENVRPNVNLNALIVPSLRDALDFS